MASWQPPTKDEFKEWYTGLDAIGVSDEAMADDVDKWAIVQRLQAGQIIAVARTAQVRSDVAGVQPFVPIPIGPWQRMDRNAEFYFWKTGDLVVPDIRDGVVHRGSQRYFDIRLDPASFSGAPLPTVILELEAPAKAPTQGAPAPISKAEAERFCRAILAGWPDAGQDWAYEKAQLFFPDHKVARDFFRSILRSIRGSTRPGKKPKIME